VINLGEIELKFESFGWHVTRCSGHDFDALEQALKKMGEITDRPKVLIADTIKGKGVSFMEGPTSLKEGKGLYAWHSGAPDDATFEAGYEEILERINSRLKDFDLAPVTTEPIETRERARVRLKDTAERVVGAFEEALAEIGTERTDVVVLDADLAGDCGLRAFQNAFPDRFIENGIAEQDMVSMAGGLALQGLLPVVNSFGVFLASRANEQIYNNATENSKIIYVCHYAGLIPAGPGKSHQSLRDVSLFGALPNCVVMEPCNGVEVRQALKWCVEEASESCMMRLIISPSPRTILLPDGYAFAFGQGCVVRDGTDAVLFSYGPVMLNEALVAAETLDEQGISLRVVNLPWLNRVDLPWLETTTGDLGVAFALDNHSTYGGLGDNLLNAFMTSDALRGRKLVKFGVEGHAACGTPPEALRAHGLDGASLAGRIVQVMSRN
jgi:transketolase